MERKIKHSVYLLHRIPQRQDALQGEEKVKHILVRVNKLYKEMARFIGTRNALQCRSHHQKLEDRYLYPNKIIANYKQHNDLALYHQIRQELEDFEGRVASVPTCHLKL
jgi:hypothetical protein